MAKVVIDANVIISAAYGGKPLEAVTRALEKHEVYLSDSIGGELEKKPLLNFPENSPESRSSSSKNGSVRLWP